jgi:hypothetical protein
MDGTGFQSVAANHDPIPRFPTTGINPWQTALKCTVLRFAITEITP